MMTRGEYQSAISISIVIAIAVGFNVILNLVLIPPYGMAGDDFSTAISLALHYIDNAWFVWRRLKFRICVL